MLTFKTVAFAGGSGQGGSAHKCGGVYFVVFKRIPIGLESTERFGRGLDPDMAGTVGRSNFFNRFGTSARATGCRVDSARTNFSQRSYPRHPDSLLRGWMLKSTSFGFDWKRLRTSFGPTLGPGGGEVSCLNSRHLSCLNSRHQHQHSSLSISIQCQQSPQYGGYDSRLSSCYHEGWGIKRPCAPIAVVILTAYGFGSSKTRMT